MDSILSELNSNDGSSSDIANISSIFKNGLTIKDGEQLKTVSKDLQDTINKIESIKSNDIKDSRTSTNDDDDDNDGDNNEANANNHTTENVSKKRKI